VLLRAIFDVDYFPPNAPPFRFAVSQSAIIAPCHPPRRFPPWSVEETDACFIIRDNNRQAVAYVYCEDEPGRRSTATC